MFRKEVAEAKAYRLLGKITLVQPISTYFITLIAVVFFIIIAIFITMASYSRKESVRGYITPKSGVVKVFSNKTGIIDSIYVKEGSKVKQSTPLLKIRNSQNLSTGEELSTQLIYELKSQISSLKQEHDTIDSLSNKELSKLKRQIAELYVKIDAINSAKNINRRKIDLKKSKIIKNKMLLGKGYISTNQLDMIEEELLEVLSEDNRLDSEFININTEIKLLNSDINSHPEQVTLKKAAIMRKISELKSQVTEISENYEFVQTAPESGVITSIQSTVGDRVNNSTLLLSIVPENSPLEIELLLPTRTAGFVENGDSINIRFDAFPYQKFGFTRGRIINIDRTVLLSSDRILPIPISEAVYRARAILDRQSINAYGKTFPLKIGMLADADIILERRSLLEWLLDPIYAVKGKI